jgi:predicted acyltransferase
MALSKDASGVFVGVREELAYAASRSYAASSGQRLVSLDVLRGFAMFWLIGGREFILAIVAFVYPPWFDAFETQVTHPRWIGFVAWDLVMPVFLFVVGASMPLAMAKWRESGGTMGPAYWRIARRVAVLWLLGTLTQASKPEAEGPELYSNALQAIAAGYLVTSLALLHLRVRGQVALFFALLLGYAALLMFVPFPDHPAGTLQRTANLPRYVDEILLGDYRCEHSFTWVVTSLGFAATVLLGAMAGHLLKVRQSSGRKLLWLTATGVGCMAAGWLWSYWLPLNRHLWTSSMVLWGGGVSFLLVAVLYAVIDVGGFRRWSFPLMIIGSNALLAYVLDPAFDQASNLLVLKWIPDCPSPYFGLLSSFCEMASLWVILWVLYRKRLFLRA